MIAMHPLEGTHHDVTIDTGVTTLVGTLDCPRGSRGLVVFAHGGISRFSPRNRFLATLLHAAPLATLLVDWLTEEEATHSRRPGLAHDPTVLDIPVLTRRLVAATDWILHEPWLGGLPLGYFGAASGAAAALRAAAERRAVVRAIVSRSGRPDLAGDALDDVWAPTLLIVTGHDDALLAANRRALDRLAPRIEAQLAPVAAGDADVFESPLALQVVGDLAVEWFTRHLSPAANVAP